MVSAMRKPKVWISHLETLTASSRFALNQKINRIIESVILAKPPELPEPIILMNTKESEATSKYRKRRMMKKELSASHFIDRERKLQVWSVQARK